MEISELQNLPSYFTTTERSRYKFYKNKDDYNNSKNYKIREIPNEGSIVYAFVNISFLKEHNLKTIKDAIGLLNEWGYNRTVYENIRYNGFHFDSVSWSWNHENNPDNPLVKVLKNGAGSNTSIFVKQDSVKKYDCYDYGVSHDSLFVFYYKESSKLPSISTPSWMIDLQGYKFVPDEYKFMRDKDLSELTFGVEIEVAAKLSRFDLQYLVTEIEPKQEPFFYFKHDGSIGEHNSRESYEIVTMPCTYRFLSQNLRILFNKIREHVPDSDDVFSTPESCGVHIHVSKDSFYSELHRHKFVAIWNQYDSINSGFIQKLGMRKFNNYCKPAESHDGLTVARRLSKGNYAPGHSNGKYSSCRETGATVEVRVFKGGFTYDHLMYCLETVHAMHNFAHKSPISFISSRRFISEFTGWVESERRYKRLKENLRKCA